MPEKETEKTEEESTQIDRDSIFKKIFGDKELFIMFLKDFVKADWTKILTPEDITVMPTTFIDLKEGNKESDIIYKINLKEKQEDIFIFLLLEHQSSVNYLMNYRMLEYMVKIWRAYIDEEDTKVLNENGKPIEISRRKTFMLPPVFPILFYEGTEKWKVEKEFKHKVIDYEKFKKYIPNFEYVLIDINEIGFDELAEKSDIISLILTFDKLKDMKDFEKAKQMKKEVWDNLKYLTGTRILNIVADVIKAFLTVINVPQEEMDKIIEKIYEGRFSEMFTMAMDYNVVEVRKEAAKEAAEDADYKAKLKMAKKMIIKGEPIEKIMEYSELSKQKIEELKNSIVKN